MLIKEAKIIDAWVEENAAVNTSTRKLNRDWQTLITIKTMQKTERIKTEQLFTIINPVVPHL